MIERHPFFCRCSSPEHQFIIDWYDEELFLSVNLSDYRGFWGRLWYGLKYAFGYQSRYGAWDCVLIDRDTAAKLMDLCQRYVNGDL